MIARSRLTRSSKAQLAVLLNGKIAGEVYRAGNGRLAFVYDEKWRGDSSSYPLSLSLPLSASEHGDRAIRSYLWGLLPDNHEVLRWWARRYGVSSFNPLDLLLHVGEDCAGAVQLSAPDKIARLLGAADETKQAITWISNEEVEHRLRELRLNPAAGRAPGDSGHFSLAGAQPKTALCQNLNGMFGVPEGRTPSDCILKPPMLGLDALEYNEHFCLQLAAELGLPAARSQVRRFGDEVAIVVTRYDRIIRNGIRLRVHQEDMCQAQGLDPARKYESDGGPGVVSIARILKMYSSEPDLDVLRFIDAVALNWLIAGSDGHAKNYAILHAYGPQLRLAPLYDVISVLPYPQLTHGDNRLAMSVGGERVIARIGGREWRTLAKEIGMSADVMLERVTSLATRLPAAVERLRSQRDNDDTMRGMIDRFGEQVIEHARRCARRL